jgi:hypothetical protein
MEDFSYSPLSSSKRYESNLVLTPQADAYLLVIAYGEVRALLGCLVEFLQALPRF